MWANEQLLAEAPASRVSRNFTRRTLSQNQRWLLQIPCRHWLPKADHTMFTLVAATSSTWRCVDPQELLLTSCIRRQSQLSLNVPTIHHRFFLESIDVGVRIFAHWSSRCQSLFVFRALCTACLLLINRARREKTLSWSGTGCLEVTMVIETALIASISRCQLYLLNRWSTFMLQRCLRLSWLDEQTCGRPGSARAVNSIFVKLNEAIEVAILVSWRFPLGLSRH